MRSSNSRSVLRLNPDDLNAWNNLIFAYYNVRQFDEAVAAAQKTLKLARSQGQTATAGQIEKWLQSIPPRRPQAINRSYVISAI